LHSCLCASSCGDEVVRMRLWTPFVLHRWRSRGVHVCRDMPLLCDPNVRSYICDPWVGPTRDPTYEPRRNALWLRAPGIEMWSHDPPVVAWEAIGQRVPLSSIIGTFMLPEPFPWRNDPHTDRIVVRTWTELLASPESPIRVGAPYLVAVRVHSHCERWFECQLASDAPSIVLFMETSPCVIGPAQWVAFDYDTDPNFNTPVRMVAQLRTCFITCII